MPDDEDEKVPDEWVREMTFKVLYTYKLAYAEEHCQQISKQIQTLQQEHPEADLSLIHIFHLILFGCGDYSIDERG